MSILKPLVMRRTIQFSTGAEKWIEFEYENLEKHCFTCLSLSHEKKDCPKNLVHAPTTRKADDLGINQQKTLDKIVENRKLKTERREARQGDRRGLVELRRDQSKRSPPPVRSQKHSSSCYSHRSRDAADSRNPSSLSYCPRYEPYGRKEYDRREAGSRTSHGRSEHRSLSLEASHRNHSTRDRDIAESRSRSNHPRYTPRERTRDKDDAPDSERSRRSAKERLGSSPAIAQDSGGKLTSPKERRPAKERLSLGSQEAPSPVASNDLHGLGAGTSVNLLEVAVQYDTTLTDNRSSAGRSQQHDSPIQDLRNFLDRSGNRTSSTNREIVAVPQPNQAIDKEKLPLEFKLGPPPKTQRAKRRGRPVKDPTTPKPPIKRRTPKAKPVASRKKGPRSPLPGATSKKRNATRSQSSPRKKLCVDRETSKGSGKSGLNAFVPPSEESNSALVASISKVLIPSTSKGSMVFQKPSSSHQ